jgi:hypothetical protein
MATSAASCLQVSTVRLVLKLHPDMPSPATAVEVEAARPQPDALRLRYFVTGDLAKIRLPAITASRRRNGLWRHSCFEAFVRVPPSRAYFEFNFAPSMEWAAYRFDDYRQAMTPLKSFGPPHIEARLGDEGYELGTVLDLRALPDLGPEADWRLGLSAVIEDRDGHRSSWALAHPPGGPDFHHKDCFALELPAAERL